MNKKRIAIAYDFDGTLSPDYMQHSSFLPELGITENFKEEFWDKAKAIAKEDNMDEILAYMQLMLLEASYKKLSIHKNSFNKHGENITFFPGVETWFKRINKYAEESGIELEHYIISSGLREMIDGCKISGEFKYIFASGFAYNKDDIAIWPALAVNYTNKTQYLFRISKGIFNCWDNKTINKYIPEEDRHVRFENIIYIGDGETDIPAMKMTKHMNGTAIAIYNPNPKPDFYKTAEELKADSDELIKQDRANFSLPADYTEGSEIEKQVKSLIFTVATNK